MMYCHRIFLAMDIEISLPKTLVGKRVASAMIGMEVQDGTLVCSPTQQVKSLAPNKTADASHRTILVVCFAVENEQETFKP